MDTNSKEPRLMKNYVSIKKSVGERNRVTTYYWINTPIILAGRYTGNVTIFANETGS